MSYLLLSDTELLVKSVLGIAESQYEALRRSYAACPLCKHMWAWHFTPSSENDAVMLWYPHICAADTAPPISYVGFCKCPFAIDDSLEY